MASVLDLAAVLDGWDPKTPPAAMSISPDAAIDKSRLALAGKANASEAITLLLSEIERVRPVLRAARFQTIELEPATATPPEVKLARLANDLHRRVAKLNMQQALLDKARDHLVKAVACLPESRDARFEFVEIYVELGAFRDSFDLLERIYSDVPQLPDRMIQLYNLTRDIHARGALIDAHRCYKRIVALDQDGLFAELAYCQIRLIENNVIAAPKAADLRAIAQDALAQVQAGRPADASNLTEGLSWQPDSVEAWLALGYLYQGASVKSGRFRLVRANNAIGCRLVSDDLDGIRLAGLRKAVQAYRVATTYVPNMAAAYQELSTCYLMLDLPAAAADSIKVALDCAPNNKQFLSGLLAILSAVSLAVGDLAGSEVAANTALRDDPDGVMARSMLGLCASIRSKLPGVS
jgi:tetratricopeptide (TPR) repeat protein